MRILWDLQVLWGHEGKKGGPLRKPKKKSLNGEGKYRKSLA